MKEQILAVQNLPLCLAVLRRRGEGLLQIPQNLPLFPAGDLQLPFRLSHVLFFRSGTSVRS